MTTLPPNQMGSSLNCRKIVIVFSDFIKGSFAIDTQMPIVIFVGTICIVKWNEYARFRKKVVYLIFPNVITLNLSYEMLSFKCEQLWCGEKSSQDITDTVYCALPNIIVIFFHEELIFWNKSRISSFSDISWQFSIDGLTEILNKPCCILNTYNEEMMLYPARSKR